MSMNLAWADNYDADMSKVYKTTDSAVDFGAGKLTGKASGKINDAIFKEDNKDQKEAESLGKELGKQATKAAVDAAVGMATGIAISVAKQSAMAAASWGIGAAADAAAKAATAAEIAATTVKVAQTAKTVKNMAQTMPLIASIILGLTGVVAMVKCKKAKTGDIVDNKPVLATSNVVSPSFYLWSVSSIVFMVTEIVNFIKFKKLGKEIARASLENGKSQQENVEALKRQLEIVTKSRELAEKKLTWLNIAKAGYIAAEVAALAEITARVVTTDASNGQMRFIMKCTKKNEKEEPEVNACPAGDGKKVDMKKAVNSGWGNAKSSLKNSGMGMVNNTVGGRIDKKTQDAVWKNNKDYRRMNGLDDKDNHQAQPQQPRAPAATPINEHQPEEIEENIDPTIEYDDQASIKNNWSEDNQIAISHSQFKQLKETVNKELFKIKVLSLYASAASNDLVSQLIQADSSTDSYFLFDEWHRNHAEGVISASIDSYQSMKKQGKLKEFLDDVYGERNVLGKIMAQSLTVTSSMGQFLNQAFSIPLAHANDTCSAGGGKGKGNAGKAIAGFMLTFLLDRVFNLAEPGKEILAEKTTGVINKTVHGDMAEKTDAEIEAEEAQLAKEEEEIMRQSYIVDERISQTQDDIDTSQDAQYEIDDILATRAEDRAIAAEEAAEEDDDEEDQPGWDDEEEEEELIKVYYFEEDQEEEVDFESMSDDELKLYQAKLKAQEEQKRQEMLAQEQKYDELDKQNEELYTKQEEEETKREEYNNSLQGKMKTAAAEEAQGQVEGGMDAATDWVRGEAENGLNSLMFKKKEDPVANSGTGSGKAEGSANIDKNDENIANENGNGRGATANSKKGLKGKIKDLWEKLGKMLEKMLSTEIKRSLVSGASIWIMVETTKALKKNIDALKKQEKDLKKIIDEMQSAKSEKIALGSGGSAPEANNYGGPTSTGSTRSPGSKSYGGKGALGYNQMNGICFTGLGNSMNIDENCNCQASNSCSKVKTTKVPPGMFPSSVNSSMGSLKDTANQLANGNYSGAMMSGAQLGKNAVRLLNTRDKMQKKVNELLASKGQKPINFNKQSEKFLRGFYKEAIDSGLVDAHIEAQNLNAGFNPLNTSNAKDSYLMLSPTDRNNPAVQKELKKAGFSLGDDGFDMFSATPTPQEDVLPGLEEYDVAVDDIRKDSGKSIFDVISTRYFRSAYPALLNERKPSSSK